MNINKQKQKLHFDAHLVLGLFDAVDKSPGFKSQISSFRHLDFQVFGLLELRGLSLSSLKFTPHSNNSHLGWYRTLYEPR